MRNFVTHNLSDVADVVMGQSPASKFYNSEGCGMPFLQGSAQFGKVVPNTEIFCSAPTKTATAGSILFSVRAPVGNINRADRDYCIGRGLASIVPKKANGLYVENYLRFLRPEFDRITQGSTFGSINSRELGSVKIRMPFKQAEQAKIAAVLATVDQAIEQTEALIAKYICIKTGMMQDLLTRGIDDHGRLRDPVTQKFKPSPLGQIPDEWHVARLGSEDVSRSITSGSRGWARYYGEEGALFMRISNLTRRHVNLRWHDVKFVKPPLGAEGKRTAVDAGDLLVSITADLGIIGVAPKGLGEAYVNQHIALIKLNRARINPWFIGNWLSSHVGQNMFSRLNEAGAKAGLNLTTVASLAVVLPSPREQDHIAQVLNRADENIATQERNWEKLQRLKTGLMQDLLTGKVSVEPLLKTQTAR